jgi:hypothetical protein
MYRLSFENVTTAEVIEVIPKITIINKKIVFMVIYLIGWCFRSYRSNKIVIQSEAIIVNLHHAYIDGIKPPQVIKVLCNFLWYIIETIEKI